tara:strand:- start:4927 stop:5118 length:192 start_codon:yes stop_codon:yes gene_type:complete
MELIDCDFGESESLTIKRDKHSVILSHDGVELFGIQFNAELSCIQVVKWNDNGEVVESMVQDV